MQNAIETVVSALEPRKPNDIALDGAQEMLQAGRVAGALDALFDDLTDRREEDPAEWPEYARSCLNHPLRQLLHQDPFTYRAFAKPRGYAGDAVMMDYIYRLGSTTQAARETTPLGRAIFAYMASRPSARAVRYRRRLIADLIDRTAARGGRRAFALAAGHLREAEVSNALASGQLEEFAALDQDPESLGLIDRDYGRLGVRTIHGSVRQVLSRKVRAGEFDFVYAAGLFDYLAAPVAAALARRMFEMTRPGGLMLIPNFLVGAPDTAYMEAFMDWHLIYRDHAAMETIAASLPQDEIAGREIFDDEDKTITFLLVSKRSSS